MGSPIRMSVVGGSRRAGQAARDAAWEELATVDEQLSRFQPASDLSVVNASAGSGRWSPASRRLRAMTALAWRAQRMTADRFDARVIGVLEDIGERAGMELPPLDPDTVRWLGRHGRSPRIRLASPIDSGGVGKGLGLRWAIAAARMAAPMVPGILLEVGGDIVVHGRGPAGGPWAIGIEDPLDPAELLATIEVPGGAVATSSTAVRSWTFAGRPVHHLIDPSRGAPAETGLLSVSVAMSDPAWAEVWSKALFLAGRSQIGPEARNRRQAAWWVEGDGSLHMTPAALDITTWVRGEPTAF